MEKFKPVIIEWTDCTYSGGLYSEVEVENFTLLKMKTTGFGIEKEDRWVLARESNSDGNYRHIIAIPKVNISKITVLRRK